MRGVVERLHEPDATEADEGRQADVGKSETADGRQRQPEHAVEQRLNRAAVGDDQERPGSALGRVRFERGPNTCREFCPGLAIGRAGVGVVRTKPPSEVRIARLDLRERLARPGPEMLLALTRFAWRRARKSWSTPWKKKYSLGR